jgi:hypothetical protein
MIGFFRGGFGFRPDAVRASYIAEPPSSLEGLTVTWGALAPGEDPCAWFASKKELSFAWSKAAFYVVDKMHDSGLDEQISQNILLLLERLGFQALRGRSFSMVVSEALQAFHHNDIVQLLRVGGAFLKKIDELLQNYQAMPAGDRKNQFLDQLNLYLFEAVQSTGACAPGITSRFNYFLTIADFLNSENSIHSTLHLLKNHVFLETVLMFYYDRSVIHPILRDGNDIHYVAAVKKIVASDFNFLGPQVEDPYANAMQQDVEDDLKNGLFFMLQRQLMDSHLFLQLAKQCRSDFQELLGRYGLAFPIVINTKHYALDLIQSVMQCLELKYGSLDYALFLTENGSELGLENNLDLLALQLAKNAGILLGHEHPLTKTLFTFSTGFFSYDIKRNGSLQWMDLVNRSNHQMHSEAYDDQVVQNYLINMTAAQLDNHIFEPSHQRWLKVFFRKAVDNKNNEIFQSFSRNEFFINESKALLLHAAIKNNQNRLDYLIDHGVVLDGRWLVTANGALFLDISQRNFNRIGSFLRICGSSEVMSHRGKTPLVTAIENADLEMVKFLLAAGADINGKCSNGNTPLIAAIKYNKIQIAQYLIEQGAEVNQQNN